MDYEGMLQQFLKLTTMYNIINGTSYFPTDKIIFPIPVVKLY